MVDNQQSKDITLTANSTIPESHGEYTIQIMALLKPHDAKIFKKLDNENLYKSYGKDGFCRYTYGLFNNYNDAVLKLHKIIDLGFKDAYIRKISEIDNFNEN